jgi:hypothetical protein
MDTPTFEWDRAKAGINFRKHGVSFEEAVTVFQNRLARVHSDPDHSASERRQIIVGHSERKAHGKQPGASEKPMKKADKTHRELTDDLRPEYDFDYSKAKKNPYAAYVKGRTVAVVLDPDVAATFPTSRAVNALLRSVAAAIPRRARRPRTRSGRTA